MQYHGKPIALHEDYTLKVMEQWAAYRDVMQQLYKRGLKPSLLYPTRLLITTEKRERRGLTSVEDAKEYLAVKLASRNILSTQWCGLDRRQTLHRCLDCFSFFFFSFAKCLMMCWHSELLHRGEDLHWSPSLLPLIQGLLSQNCFRLKTCWSIHILLLLSYTDRLLIISYASLLLHLCVHIWCRETW